MLYVINSLKILFLYIFILSCLMQDNSPPSKIFSACINVNMPQEVPSLCKAPFIFRQFHLFNGFEV